MKTLTTTDLSKKLGIDSKALSEKLVELQYVFYNEGKKHLTKKGEEVGGKVISTEKIKDFIVWPENFNPLSPTTEVHNNYINASTIADDFSISNQRVNNILSELGWIERAIKGWTVTPLGRNIGGLQKEHQTGAKYVLWPESILKNNIFLKAINPTQFLPEQILSETTVEIKSQNKSENKYPDTLLKTRDGHQVRSRAEMIIDNLLYDYGLTHAYERELTVAETVFSDFYIPARNGGKAVYIEFWGISDNEKYSERKKIKQEIYKNNNLNLIELEDKHLENIDSYLRKALLKFNINVD